MEAFLVKTLDKLKTNNYADLHLVLGNESCDLDSAVSALVYAAYLHWQYTQIKCKVCTRVHRDEALYKDDLFVPILNVVREDFPLKTEVAFCLKEHGIDDAKLVFRDDIDLKVLVSTRKSNIILVDHHVLPKKDQFLVPFVTEVIDHRPMDKDSWNYKENTRSTMDLVGSCCTLVARRIKHLGALVAKDEDFFIAHPVCTEMLHSTIILDTVNFSKAVNKATPADEEMVLFLESILKPNNFYEENRKSKLDRLVGARKDVSSLSAAQLLRKDVKIVADVLVPSFPILVEEYLQKPEALPAVTEALQRRECTLALLLGMSLEPELKRDAAVYSSLPDRAVKFAKHLQQWVLPSLQLTPLDLNVDKAGYIYMKQNNLSASRKQYMPAINGFLQQPKDSKE